MKRGTHLGVMGDGRVENPSELNGAVMIGWAESRDGGGRLVRGSFICGEERDAVVWECMYENRYTYESMCYVRIYIPGWQRPLERAKRTSIRLRTLLPIEL